MTAAFQASRDFLAVLHSVCNIIRKMHELCRMVIELKCVSDQVKKDKSTLKNQACSLPPPKKKTSTVALLLNPNKKYIEKNT